MVVYDFVQALAISQLHKIIVGVSPKMLHFFQNCYNFQNKFLLVQGFLI